MTSLSTTMNKNKLRNPTAVLILTLFFSAFSYADSWWEENLDPTNWTATWATASKTITPFDGPLPTINDITIRQIVRISEGGRMVRVSLTNEFGTAPLNVGEARVAVRASGSAIDALTDAALTFSGSPGIAIAPGGRAVSDPIAMNVADLSDLVISIYLPDDVTSSGSPVSYHVRGLQTNYISSGNQTAAEDLATSETTPSYFFLASVDVANYWPMPVIATLGDSITDGDQTAPEPVDLNDRYPNLLSEAIIAGGKSAGVVNLGISGNQVTTNFLGENPAARLSRDILTQTGVTHVIFVAGINDIGLPVLLNVLGIPTPLVSADQIIEAHKQVIARAKASGIVAIGGTLSPSGSFSLPGYSGDDAESKRQAVNAWIRNSGAYDVVVDFDAALADSSDPTIMNPALTADGLHPNSAGYQVMAEAVFAVIAAFLPTKRFEGN
jgi:lysophospholipase L1-like esterase